MLANSFVTGTIAEASEKIRQAYKHRNKVIVCFFNSSTMLYTEPYSI